MDQPPPGERSASFFQTGRWQRPLTLIYGILLFLGSVLPANGLPKIIDWSGLFTQDKIAHFGAYAVFAVLLACCFLNLSRGEAVFRGILLSAAFGALMEVLQGIAGTGREADPVDMVANLIGGLLGGLFVAAVWNKLQARRATVRRE